MQSLRVLCQSYTGHLQYAQKSIFLRINKSADHQTIEQFQNDHYHRDIREVINYAVEHQSHTVIILPLEYCSPIYQDSRKA